MKIVLVTGGFDPLHSGHIAYFNAAKQLGDRLIVGLNSDKWLTRKKGRPFMSINERFAIISELSVVDEVIVYNDDDGSSCNAIRSVQMQYPSDKLVFANGGDRTKDNIPEMIFDNVEFVFGVGGENKKNSSSWILENWITPKTERNWGHYKILHNLVGCKVKELVIEPGKSLSMQRHFKRAEHWYVLKGKCNVEILKENVSTVDTIEQNHSYVIGQAVWHRAFNDFLEPCHILEVQHGESCLEEDIERM
jgi:cytidyltransferase-like protein